MSVTWPVVNQKYFLTFAVMNRMKVKKISILTLLLLGSAALLLFAWQISAKSKISEPVAPEKVNLALRRTAHLLLKELGDTTSRIPPVEQTGANTWLVRLERPFSYDRLPTLLQTSFELHQIRDNYDVAVLNCATGGLELGYNYFDFVQSKDATCGGREVGSGCYNLQVTFSALPNPSKEFPVPVLMIFLAAGILAAVFYQSGRNVRSVVDQIDIEKTIPESADWLHFGNSHLHPSNQVLQCVAVQHQLTFREAKLLNLFVNHPNQLLDRSFILQNVWADEGILVGRSIDVFVSRLRKILRDDPSVRLVAVHGVGYKMEID
jgi:hypothetical protein